MDWRLIAWIAVGACLGSLTTILAAGLGSNDKLLAAILMEPFLWLKYPCVVGALGGAGFRFTRYG